MDLLVLGGTGWLGGEVAAQALHRGHRVTCLARGSAPVPDGCELVRADRTVPGAYDALAGRRFDAVVDVTRQPGQVRGALEALASRVGHWGFVSTGNVYADHSRPGGVESDPLLPAAGSDEVGAEQYGEGKVACEMLCAQHVGDRLLVARAGLIGGVGDPTGRAVAWARRAALAPEAAMLVPDAPDQPTQVVDVADLSAYLLDAAESGLTGRYDAVGPVLPLGEWIALSRQVGGHTGDVVAADPGWLLEQGVGQFMGPESMAMWIAEPSMAGFSARTGAAAAATGLRHRPREELLRRALADDLAQDPPRTAAAGLSLQREAELVTAWRQR